MFVKEKITSKDHVNFKIYLSFDDFAFIKPLRMVAFSEEVLQQFKKFCHFLRKFNKKYLMKLLQGHSRSKIQKKVRMWQFKSKLSSQRPPASVSNISLRKREN